MGSQGILDSQSESQDIFNSPEPGASEALEPRPSADDGIFDSEGLGEAARGDGDIFADAEVTPVFLTLVCVRPGRPGYRVPDNRHVC